jgi:hypothetical protein
VEQFSFSEVGLKRDVGEQPVECPLCDLQRQTLNLSRQAQERRAGGRGHIAPPTERA